MDHRPRLYSISVIALIAGLVLLVQLMAINGCLVRGAQTATTATPTRTPQRPATEVPTEAPTETPAPTAVPPTPTVTAVPPTSTPRPTSTPVATETPTAEPTDESSPISGSDVVSTTVSEAASAAALPPVVSPVVDPASPFFNSVWVGLYGTPGGRGLGILGTAPATETVAMAVIQAQAYKDLIPDIRVIPFFHMVVTVADPFPGPDGDYVHRVSTERIQLWIDVARANGLVCVLDIQPGYSPLESELAFVDPFLRQHGVHLALDPEFMMLDGVSVPGQRIGTMTGAHVNQAQAWLDVVAAETGERKVLVIHQFDDRMFSAKEDITDYPAVALVWDSDGFGGPGAKIADYRQYAGEPGFEHGGFKLFYDYDVPLMSPAQVLELVPLPAFVVYQ